MNYDYRENRPELDFTGMECRGCTEIEGIRCLSPEEIIVDVYRCVDNGFLIFTDIIEFGNGNKNKSVGEELHEFISEHKLGSVVVTEPKINHNSGNKICVWVWSPYYTKVEKLAREILKQTKNT